jgi:antitoxin component HigA of HigAB toxin-antitoxin module
MKQQVRVIKTQHDYDAAIARLSALMDDEIASDSIEEAELELLALVIESWERSKVAPVSPDPIDAILFCMDQQNLSKKDLVPYLGSLSSAEQTKTTSTFQQTRHSTTMTPIARLSAWHEIASGPIEEAELLLALVIESWERSKVAPVSPDPIDAFCFADQSSARRIVGSMRRIS